MVTGTLITTTLLTSMLLAVPKPVPTGWKTIAASGRVEAQAGQPAGPAASSQATPGAWRPVRRGDVVAAASHVRTWEKARATLTRQGDLILVDAGTEIVLPETVPGQGTVVMQTSGNAIYKVSPREAGAGRFEVRTPFLVAGVKGTRFSVQIHGGRAAVDVLEGVVEVRSLLTGETQDLKAGESAIVEGHEGRMDLHQENRSLRPVDRPVLDSDLGFDDVATTSETLDRTLSTSLSLAADLDADLWADLKEDLSLRSLLNGEDRQRAGATSTDTTTQEQKEEKSLLDTLPLLPRK